MLQVIQARTKRGPWVTLSRIADPKSGPSFKYQSSELKGAQWGLPALKDSYSSKMDFGPKGLRTAEGQTKVVPVLLDEVSPILTLLKVRIYSKRI